MTTLEQIAAQEAHNTSVQNNKRGAAIVRVCGEEHSAISDGNKAVIFLAHDNDMCFISDYRFKIILGNGGYTNNPNAPVPMNVPHGIKLYSSVNAFKTAYPLGSALDVDGYYGAQCVDYANAFWWGMVGRGIDCGEDNARGIWDVSRVKNAGTEFTTSTDWSSIKAGDWLVWGGGTYGHIAMAVSSPTGNNVVVWNQNVSGTPWPAGGRALSQDTWSNANFLGYFRYKW